MQITPQRVNRGGNLAPSEVIGRDGIIQRLWETLDRQSVVLTAERRMGKTSVVKKMRAEAPSGLTAVYRSFEAVRTRREFVEALLTDLRDHLPVVFRARTKLTGLLKDLGTVEVGSIRLDVAPTDGWKGLVQRAFSMLDADDEKMVFFWDEVPIMLGAIAEEEGPEAAEDLLNTLRYVRQTYEGVRMVFTGSVGLHHVVAGIRPDRYVNAPTNDMLTVTVGGLERDDAVLLARNLFAGEHLACTKEEVVAETITDCTSGIPFYIQNVVGMLCDRNERRKAPVSQADVEEVIDDALHDPVDPWELRQYRQRIDTYYGQNVELALTTLDILAVAEENVPFPTLTNLVNSRLRASDEDIRSVLELLQLDHYIDRADGGYCFAFDIVARSWRSRRDLGAR